MALGMNNRMMAVEDNGPRRKRPEEENVSLDSIVETTPYQQRLSDIRNGVNTAKPVNYSLQASPEETSTARHYEPTGGMSLPPSYRKFYEDQEEPEEEQPFNEIIEAPERPQVPSYEEAIRQSQQMSAEDIAAQKRQDEQNASALDNLRIRNQAAQQEEAEGTAPVPETPAETYDAWEKFIEQQEQAQEANDELFRQSLNQPEQSALGGSYVQPVAQPDNGLAEAERQRLQQWVNNMGAAQRAGYEYTPPEPGTATAASALPETPPEGWMGSKSDWDNYRNAFANVNYSQGQADALWDQTYRDLLDNYGVRAPSDVTAGLVEADRQHLLDQAKAIADQRRADERNANYLADLIEANREDARRADSAYEEWLLQNLNGYSQENNPFSAEERQQMYDQAKQNQSQKEAQQIADRKRADDAAAEELNRKRLERENERYAGLPDPQVIDLNNQPPSFTEERSAILKTIGDNIAGGVRKRNAILRGILGGGDKKDQPAAGTSSNNNAVSIDDPLIQNDPEFKQIRDNLIAQGWNPQAAANSAYASVLGSLQDKSRGIANDIVDQALLSIGEDAESNLTDSQLDELYKNAEEAANQQVYGNTAADNTSPFPIETNAEKADRLEQMTQDMLNGGTGTSEVPASVRNARATDGMIPGYNADGTPNAALDSIMKGEWNISMDGVTNQDALDTIHQGNADRILSAINPNDIIVPLGLEPYLASDRWTASGNLDALVLGENGLADTSNRQNVETVNATQEEMQNAIKEFVKANPIYEDLIKSGQIDYSDLMRYYFKAPDFLVSQTGTGSGANGTGANGKNSGVTYFNPSYGQDMKQGVKLPYKSGGYSDKDLQDAGNKPYKGSNGYDQYEGYYYWNGRWYPVDQPKADYYLANGTYQGYTPDLAEYYRTYGTYRGYTPNWRNYGNGGGGSYSRSYSGGGYSNYGYPPETTYQQAQRINNIMKNWSF